MANITKRMTKTGATYRIKVSLGYDETYKQITKSMTFKPKPGMTERQIKAELNRQAVLFEEKTRQEHEEHLKRIERGEVDDLSLTARRVRFKALAEEWLELMETTHEMKPATLVRMKAMKGRTYQAFGNVFVDLITYRQIQQFITGLSKPGVNLRTGAEDCRKKRSCIMSHLFPT